MKRERKDRKQFCFSLSQQAMDLVRSVSIEIGVPMSRICEEALTAAANRRLEDHVMARRARELQEQARK